MRKITVLSMITLDGVLQGPGGPEEDTSDGFTYGGWVAPYDDDISGEIVRRELQQADYLLGRKTFDIWEAYWPGHAEFWPGINEGMKYVMSTTRDQSEWKNTAFIRDVAAIRELKHTNGPDIQVWGSGQLIQLLLQNDLVDELRLKIHPLTLGRGKKLFTDGAIPAAFELIDSTVTTRGVIMVNYRRAGEVKTGTVGD